MVVLSMLPGRRTSGRPRRGTLAPVSPAGVRPGRFAPGKPLRRFLLGVVGVGEVAAAGRRVHVGLEPDRTGPRHVDALLENASVAWLDRAGRGHFRPVRPG